MHDLVHSNVAVHPAEGRRRAPLPRIGCNGWVGPQLFTAREFIGELLTSSLRCSRQVAQRSEADRRRCLGLGLGDFKDTDATIGATAHRCIDVAIKSAGRGKYLN